MALFALWAAACSVPKEDGTRPPGHDVVVIPGQGAVAERTADGAAIWTSTHAFILINRGQFSFAWLLEPSEPWLGCLVARSGQLAVADSLRIELSIDASIAPTSPGAHRAELRVLNAMTFHREAAIEVTWNVAAGAPTDAPATGRR